MRAYLSVPTTSPAGAIGSAPDDATRRIAVNIATVPDFGRDVKFQTGNLKEKFLLMIFTSCTSDGGV